MYCDALQYTIRRQGSEYKGSEVIASEATERPAHPSVYVRRHVIPEGMTVTKAAALLGIGRPALSNFLNGKAALSQRMALRLERAFGADLEALLNLQAHYDRRDEAMSRPVVVGRHAPELAAIRAKDIDDWADRIDARHELPALLRRLVHSTGCELTRVDFPAFDNAERPGWDGVVQAKTPTPWVPEGKSGWEFGCNQVPQRKAQDDYDARVKSVPSQERRDMTFVFVTPRNWPGKETWGKKKAALGDWKDVRAHDASDLEQWLEQSAPAQVWFAERRGNQVSGYRSLDRCWSDWAEACDPVLSPALFAAGVEEFSAELQRWLAEPPTRPFIVVADSRNEALAFLCCLVGEATSEKDEPGVGALVFDTPEAIRRFRASNVVPRIVVVHTDHVEKEIGDLHRRCHCVIVRPGNDVNAKSDISLALPGRKYFSDALESMGLSGDRIDMLAREAGRSPTVLRRRLSTIPAVRAPAWADDAQTARKLLPAALVGAWRKTSPSDCEVVRRLARTGDDNDMENDVMVLLALEDSPLWTTGEYRGVVSRTDALFGIARFVTESDLINFFSVAEGVLAEADPALELPEDERWLADIYGKVRVHSAVLRKGIRETLVLLSVHGNTLFRNLGVDLEAQVSSLVHRLLTPLTISKLLSHQGDLPNYAEATPDTFLKLIEADLREPEPAVFGLLKPAESGPFGRCLRTGLLWALECLAWNHLGRVSLILARLSTIRIDDNLGNKPFASLSGLYRSWLPRTAASLPERMEALETLTKRFPDVGWRVCIALDTGPRMALPSYRPRWRDVAASANATLEEFHEFRRKALALALEWPDHDQRTLGDLLERIHGLPDEDKGTIWDLIETWADSGADDREKARLRDRIRQFAFTRRGRQHGLRGTAIDRAHAAYDRLEPRDPVVRHAWLFTKLWIEPSVDGIEEGERDHKKDAETIRGLRAAAMKEIWAERGFEGVTAVLSDSGAPGVVGAGLEPCIPDGEARVDFLRQCLSVTGHLQVKAELCIRGFVWSVGDDARSNLLEAAAVGAHTGEIVRLYLCAPFGRHSWRLLDRYDREVQDRYWREVLPEWSRYDEAELIELIDRLLNAKRPRAALHAAQLDWSKIETSGLKRILFDVGTANTEPAVQYMIESHDISEALNELDGRAGVSRDEMARLEFMYVQALESSEHGIPNLEQWLSESPLGFVQILAFVSKRDDGGQDPPEWQTKDTEKQAALVTAAYTLLRRISRIPGTGEGGDIDVVVLSQWIAEARRLCAAHDRAEIGDRYIGKILSRAPADDAGIKPCLAVCEALERVRSPAIGFGFNIGINDERGVVSRALGEGGGQERELAEKYRSWARQRSPRYPYVGSILEDIAVDYDRQALRQDEKAKTDLRLEH